MPSLYTRLIDTLFYASFYLWLNSPKFTNLIQSNLQRNRIGSENPSDVFRFLVEERIQCCQTRKVRYTERVDYLMQLPVAMEAATNKGNGSKVGN